MAYDVEVQDSDFEMAEEGTFRDYAKKCFIGMRNLVWNNTFEKLLLPSRQKRSRPESNLAL